MPDELKTVARVYNDVAKLPKDLYISPQALLVFLEMFEGPLDLLLYLIRKQNIDILNIPIAQITNQYVAYIEAMQVINLDLAAEYLTMAATLITIKARLMLPKNPAIDEIENDESNDPRTELINKLIEYEKIKQVSQQLDKLPVVERDFKWANVETNYHGLPPQLNINDLKTAWQHLMMRHLANNIPSYHIEKEQLSIREYMSHILKILNHSSSTTFSRLLGNQYSLSVMVVSFIAVLELTKEGFIKLGLQKNDIIVALI
jgi:segregation and condensation protein A